MNSSTPTQEENRGTSELALIHAAERLFAEHGIAGVSLRQINQAANQKNISAAHYHFGSRDGLIHAVLAHRWPALDRRRREVLDHSAERRDLRFYVELLIASMAEELRPRPEGNHYLRFVQQYERYKGDYEFAKSITPASVEIYAQIEAMISYLPEPVRRVRMSYLINLVLGVLATAEHRLEKGELKPHEIGLLTSNLVDMTLAALEAPLSMETRERLRK
jgi:AcrR family transcriptional regulator